MPKRVPTPPPPDDEPKFYTVVSPYPLNPNWNDPQDYISFARWIACVLGTAEDGGDGQKALQAVYHRPSAPRMVIIEIARSFNEKRIHTHLLGQHNWETILQKPAPEQKTRFSQVFYCLHTSNRAVQKDGFTRIDVTNDFFEARLGHGRFNVKNGVFKWPYPEAKWCEPPVEDITNKALCRALPMKKWDFIPSNDPIKREIIKQREKEKVKVVVGSAVWASTQSNRVPKSTPKSAAAAVKGTLPPDNFPAIAPQNKPPTVIVPTKTFRARPVATTSSGEGSNAWSRPLQSQGPTVARTHAPATSNESAWTKPLAPAPTSPLAYPPVPIKISSKKSSSKSSSNSGSSDVTATSSASKPTSATSTSSPPTPAAAKKSQPILASTPISEEVPTHLLSTSRSQTAVFCDEEDEDENEENYITSFEMDGMTKYEGPSVAGNPDMPVGEDTTENLWGSDPQPATEEEDVEPNPEEWADPRYPRRKPCPIHPIRRDCHKGICSAIKELTNKWERECYAIEKQIREGEKKQQKKTKGANGPKKANFTKIPTQDVDDGFSVVSRSTKLSSAGSATSTLTSTTVKTQATKSTDGWSSGPPSVISRTSSGSGSTRTRVQEHPAEVAEPVSTSDNIVSEDPWGEEDEDEW